LIHQQTTKLPQTTQKPQKRRAQCHHIGLSLLKEYAPEALITLIMTLTGEYVASTSFKIDYTGYSSQLV